MGFHFSNMELSWFLQFSSLSSLGRFIYTAAEMLTVKFYTILRPHAFLLCFRLCSSLLKSYSVVYNPLSKCDLLFELNFVWFEEGRIIFVINILIKWI